MSKEDKIQQQFKKLTQSEIQTFVAKVIGIDKKMKTITVKDIHGIDYPDVRLSAVIASGDKIVTYPKEDSWVLVSMIENMGNQLFVSLCSEAQEISGEIESTHFTINAQGFKINREDENLKLVFNDLIAEFGKLCDELSKVVVSVGVTPNVAVINTIKQQATIDIKERLNTILIA